MEHTIGSLSLTSGSTTHIGLTNLDFPTNAEVTEDDSGGLYAEAFSLTQFAPVANVTTKALADLFGFTGIVGECIGAGLNITQADIISRAIETCKDPLGNDPHLRDRVTTGLLLPGTLTADRNQDATLSAMIHTFTDGTNAPVARTDGVALPTPIARARYRLGKCKFGNVVFDNMDGVSLDFNIGTTDKTPVHGSIWPDSMGVLTVRPALTIRNRNILKVLTGAIELGATAAAHANTVLQLIQLESSGSFKSFVGNNHITITIAGLLTPESLVAAAANQRATNSITLRAAYDGTNAPVVLNLATTYDDTP